jgi:2,4-dienoyl-CoA reductase-like NADH-dependent reductase (Old Yellow Enzyme family)
MTTPLLFQPIELRGVRLRNRVVISPMCQYSAQDGHVTDWHMVHLGKFAQGGAGSSSWRHRGRARGRITHGDTGIWDDSHIPGLQRICSFVKSQGAIPALQLAHAGRKASMARPWYGNGPLTQADLDRGDKPWSIIAPTEQPLDASWIAPRAFREGDFQAVLAAYRNAVRRAIAAGFEILELHAAHGYLLHTFLSPLTNTRQDEYGGSLESRMRFPLQSWRSCAKHGPRRGRSSCALSIDDVEGGWSIEDTVAFAKS